MATECRKTIYGIARAVGGTATSDATTTGNILRMPARSLAATIAMRGGAHGHHARGSRHPAATAPDRCGIFLGFKERPKIPYRNARPYEALAIPPVGVGRTRVTALHRAARPCIALVARGEIKRNHPRGYTRRNSRKNTWDFFQVIPRINQGILVWSQRDGGCPPDRAVPTHDSLSVVSDTHVEPFWLGRQAYMCRGILA